MHKRDTGELLGSKLTVEVANDGSTCASQVNYQGKRKADLMVALAEPSMV